MNDAGAQLARAAASFIGTPFRLNGRSAEAGLDCVGLVAASLANIGRKPVPPVGYELRNSTIGVFLQAAPASGLIEVAGPISAGDIVLVAPGPGQQHLLIAESSTSFIHAHAGLRRVVRMPGPPPWPIIRHWRLSDVTMKD